MRMDSFHVFLAAEYNGGGLGVAGCHWKGSLGLGSDSVRVTCAFRAAVLGTSWALSWDLPDDVCERLSLDRMLTYV